MTIAELLRSRSVFVLPVLLFLAAFSHAQTPDKSGPQTETGPIRSSAAYSEVLLRKTELQADLEALIVDYTESNPKIIDLRNEQASLDKSVEKLFGVKPSETGKLTLALGKLIVRKAALDMDYARLSRSYSKDHPEVKRAKRRVEIFESAIQEILH